MKNKFLSLALAIAMCLGQTVPAFAAGATLTEIVSEDTWYGFFDGYTHTISGFHDGITWIGVAFRGYGAVDANGKIIVEPGTYKDAKEFSDGVAWAKRDSLWCAVDTDGRELFTLNSNDMGGNNPGNFQDGLAKIYSKEAGAYGYVDKTGELVIPFEHNFNAGDFHDGLAVVYDSANAYYGYMDKTGKTVIACQYGSAKDFVDGFAAVQMGNRWTLIDEAGKEVVPQEYSYIIESWPDNISSQAAMVRSNNGGKRSFVNKSGQIVSGDYDEARAFAGGMAVVKKDNKYGYVNEAGVLAIPCTLDHYDTFIDGYARISTDGHGACNIIDKTGQVTASLPKEIGLYARNAGNGCFRIQSSESGRTRYGLIDYTGKEIVPCQYALIGDEGLWGTNDPDFQTFSGGVAAVKNFEGKWGFVDTTGAEIVPCQYREVNYTDEPGIFVVHRDGVIDKASILKSSGWIAPSNGQP